MSEPVPNVVGEVLRQRGAVLVDLGAVTLQQAILEIAAGETEGPALSRIRRQFEDIADDLGLLQ